MIKSNIYSNEERNRIYHLLMSANINNEQVRANHVAEIKALKH